MLRTKLAKRVLTKKEQKHLTKDAAIHSLAAFKRTREYQVAELKKHPNNPWVECFECRLIAQKLGLE